MVPIFVETERNLPFGLNVKQVGIYVVPNDLRVFIDLGFSIKFHS